MFQEFIRENTTPILFFAFIGTMLIAAFFEMIKPRRSEDGKLRYRWMNNLGLAVVNQVNDGWVVVVATIAVDQWTGGRNIGILAPLELGFVSWVILAILVFECIAYWFHRALHHFPLLWRIHAVHHSDTEVDFTTVLRNHPLEIFIIAPITVPTVILLGFPYEAVIVYQALRIGINTFAHANIRLSQPVDHWVRKIIITPDYHRMHHSIDKRYTDSNFSPAFPLYDHLFGTVSHRPYADNETMLLGLEYLRDKKDSRIDQLLLLPFTWKSRVRRDNSGIQSSA